MNRQIAAVVLFFIALIQSSLADLYRVNCNIGNESIEVIVLKKGVPEASPVKEGVFFYANNRKNDLYFLIFSSNEKSFSLELFPEAARQGFAQVFGKSSFKITSVTRFEIPDSSVLMVGDVNKSEFVKISPTEKLIDLKKRVDELIPIANSLIFRNGEFQKKVAGDRYSTKIFSGDIVIVPTRSTFSYGENLHRADGQKIELDK